MASYVDEKGLNKKNRMGEKSDHAWREVWREGLRSKVGPNEKPGSHPYD
jgi:hypothetical protein